jgi:replicative DNA helicase
MTAKLGSKNFCEPSITSISNAVGHFYKRLEEFAGKGGCLPGVSSGFAGLDQMTAGFQGKTLTLINVLPGPIRHRFILSMALKIARFSRTPVGLICTASSNYQVGALMSCMSAGVDWYAISRGEFDWQELIKPLLPALQEVSELPIFVAECDADSSVDSLVTIAECMMKKECVRLVIVDHVGLATHVPPGIDSLPAEEIKAFKRLARKFHNSIIIYQHQQDENSEDRGYSYRISDLVINVSDHGPVGGSSSCKDLIRIKLEKNWDGPTGFIDCLHNRITLDLEEIDLSATKKEKGQQ